MPKNQSSRPFAAALRAEINSIGPDNFKVLRRLALALIERAGTGDVGALREFADRVDGKVPQAIVGSDEHAPISVRAIAWLDGLDKPHAPPVTIEHQAGTNVPVSGTNVPLAEVPQLPAPPEPAPEEAPFKFRYRPQHRYRTPEYNAKMKMYMRRRRAAEKAKRNGNGLNTDANTGRAEDGD